MKLIVYQKKIKCIRTGKRYLKELEMYIHEAKDLERLNKEDYYWKVVSSIKKLNSEVWEYEAIKCVCIDNNLYLFQKDMKIAMTKGQFEEIYDKHVAPF